MQPVVTGKIGVRAMLVGGPPVAEVHVAVSGEMIDHEPRMALVKAGVKPQLVGSRPCVTYSGVIGAKASIVDQTLPADSRTTWVSVTNEAQAAIYEELVVARTKQVKLSEYGRLTVFGRQFVVPRGNYGQALLDTLLAPGAHLQDVWADEWFSRAIDGPKVADVSVQQYVKDGQVAGSDVATVTFIAIKTLSDVVAGAYNATARYLEGKDAFGETWVEWGIAASLSAAGVPVAGSVLTGFSGNYAPKCIDVQPNDRTIPGRWLIRSTYRRKLANPFILKPVSVEDVFTQSGVVSIRERTVSKTATGGRKHSIGAIMG